MGDSQVTTLRQHQTVIDIPGYKIQRTLGKGGMASVYLAIQESFEREVALKVMNPSLSEDSKFSERFLREAKIVSRLVHPNIVTVYDVGVHLQQHYLSMEYIPGFDLKHKRKHLRIRESLQVVKDVARALDYASKKGYVHRDVKPENIMLHDDDGRAVLMDFGIACLSDTASGMTQTGTAIGTPHYMSPEQAKGRAVDPRSDIYSLGVVLFLLVSGRVPFDADSAVAVGIKHVSEPVPRLPKTLRALQPIIDKVMSKEPGDRYQCGIDFIEAIEAIDPAEYKAIELLTTRSVNSGIGDANTHTPTALSQAQAAVGTTARNNPDLTTVSAAALHTRNNTQVPTQSNKAVSGKTGEQLASGKTGSNPTPTPRQTGSTTPVPKNKTPAANGSRSGVTPTAVSKTPKPISANTSGQRAVTNTQRAVTKNWSDGEALFVDEDDRRDHHVEAESKSRWPWWIAALFIISAGASVYFRAYLPEAVGGPLNQLADSAVQMSDQVVAKLGLGSEQPQTVAPPPVVAAEPLVETALPVGEQNSPQKNGTGLGQQESLHDKLNKDLSVAPHLAQVYRDTLKDIPGQKNSEEGLIYVRSKLDTGIRDALQQRDIPLAQQHIATLEASFPGELETDANYLAMREQLENAQRAQVHIDKAQAFMRADNLSIPEGGNALESFRQALAVDADNPIAKDGIQTIVKRYVEKARASFQQGNYADALQSTNAGLAIDNTNGDLAKIQEDSSRQMERRSKINTMLSAARQHFDAGKLISPEGDNAFDAYKELQSFDRGNAQARSGLTEVENHLASQIEGFINTIQFDSARDLLGRALQRFPNSQRLKGFELSLERAIEEDRIARLPKIPKLLISATKPASIDEELVTTLKLERTLHVGFSYANFEGETSLVQADLLDGSRTQVLATAAVIVTGKDGIKFFQFDRPVEGFSEGGYNIELTLDEVPLQTLAFRVARQ